MYCSAMYGADLDLAQLARRFHALSDETRLRIVDLLVSGEKCVCDLQDAIGAAQSRLSFHLRVLREAGLVRDRRQGRWNFYSLRPEVLEQMAAYLRERRPDEAAWGACGCTETHEGRCCD
jgi:ArsR family transcriptional regulator, arsenate/arsenite/antimonite-responsive transcriptional repressor